ncbi:glucoside xylosyltransferase 2-like isoform X4 [Scylla paramamosain]|uniref:glucoside xylosyltransferase 2-like isoform X4 n=1 Tax=Scylla paramamosain TaxID=85552 RepID=UPI003083D47B
MRFLYKVLCVLAVVAMVVPLLTRLPHEPLTASFHSKATTEEPEFAIVVCRDKNDSEKDATGFQRQLRQISVLLKSAASLTSETLIFNIVADSYATYETVTNLTASWPAAYRERVVFDEFKEVFYPPGAEDMMNMFRLCATERLFLAQTFEDKDAVVFLDTDTLFLMPPENLWRKVYEFNPHQVIGIAPCLYMYGPRFKKTTAKHLYELGCEWNYREKLCSKGRNKCKRAQQLGVGLLHGAALTFVNDKEQKFQAVFDAWERHQLGESEKALLASLRTTLRRQKRSQGCSRLHFIDKILLQGLENTLRGRH